MTTMVECSVNFTEEDEEVIGIYFLLKLVKISNFESLESFHIDYQVDNRFDVLDPSNTFHLRITFRSIEDGRYTKRHTDI